MHYNYNPPESWDHYTKKNYPSRYKVTFTHGLVTLSIHVHAEDASRATFEATKAVCNEFHCGTSSLKHVSTILDP